MTKIILRSMMICCLCLAGISCSNSSARNLNQADLGLMPVKLGEKWTYINPQGKYEFDRLFEDAEWYSEGLASVKSGGKWGYVDFTGEYAIKPQFENAKSFHNGLALIKSGGKWGYVDFTGKYAIKPQFEDAGLFHDGLALIKSGGKWGYINPKGEYVINPQFKKVNPFYDGLARIESADGKVGYIGTDGKYVIAANYQDGTDFFGERAFVLSASGEVVCIDKTGNAKFTLRQARYVWGFSEGLTIFLSTDGEIKFVNKSGTVVFEENYGWNDICCLLWVNNFSDGMSLIYQDDKYGFISKTGGFISPQFNYAYDFSEGLAAVKLNDQWGFIDKTGQFVVKPQFRGAERFKNGWAKVYLSDGRKGFVDKTGKFVIQPQNEYIRYFSEGLVAVKLNGKWGFTDQTGKFVINPKFDYAYDFSEGLAAVNLNDQWGFIDKTGQFVIKLQQFDDGTEYGNINHYGYIFSEGLAAVKSNGKWGYIDTTGRFLIYPKFNLAGEFHDGMASVDVFDRGRDDGYFSSVIDKSGEILYETFVDDKDSPSITRFPNGVIGVCCYVGSIKGEILLNATTGRKIAQVEATKRLSKRDDGYYGFDALLFSVANGKIENVSMPNCQ